MHFKITDNIFTLFPEAVIGLVIARDIENSGASEAVLNLLRQAEADGPDKLGDTPIIQHPHIAPWREAYRAFGAKPKKYPSSIENLVRRTQKGYQLPHINLLVDIYNAISLKYLLPVGGEDLHAISGDILLTTAAEDESAVHLLGEREARPPYPGEVIYKDDVGTICRRWNWKEADRTKLTETTRNAILVIERLPPVPTETVTTALLDLAALIETYCGGTTRTAVLNAENRQVDL